MVQVFAQAGEIHRDTGIGECENGNDDVGHREMQSVLEPLRGGLRQGGPVVECSYQRPETIVVDNIRVVRNSLLHFDRAFLDAVNKRLRFEFGANRV